MNFWRISGVCMREGYNTGFGGGGPGAKTGCENRRQETNQDDSRRQETTKNNSKNV
jgi:hypothetical protein